MSESADCFVKDFAALGVPQLVKAREDFSLRRKIVATAGAVALTIALGAVDYLTGRE